VTLRDRSFWVPGRKEFEETEVKFQQKWRRFCQHFAKGSTSAFVSSALMLHFVCITPDPTLGKYGCVWLSSQPVPGGPGLLRIVISVSDSESAAIRVPSQHVRVRFSRSPKLVRQCPSRPSESWPSRDFRVSSSTRSESASCGGGYCLRVDCPPRVLANLAVRCVRLPQGGRATRPLPGAGYGAGAGGTLPYSGWAA
jgi:hypothetical protein